MLEDDAGQLYTRSWQDNDKRHVSWPAHLSDDQPAPVHARGRFRQLMGDQLLQSLERLPDELRRQTYRNDLEADIQRLYAERKPKTIDELTQRLREMMGSRWTPYVERIVLDRLVGRPIQ